MKQKTYLWLLALLLATSGCDNQPDCLNCVEDWERKEFYKDARGIVKYHDILLNLKIVELYDNDKLINNIALPSCNDTSIYPIGTEIKLSGYWVEIPPEGNIIPNPFCYTNVEVINPDEPK